MKYPRTVIRSVHKSGPPRKKSPKGPKRGPLFSEIGDKRGPTMLQKGDLLQPTGPLPTHRMIWYGKGRFYVCVTGMTSIIFLLPESEEYHQTQGWPYFSSSRERTKRFGNDLNRKGTNILKRGPKGDQFLPNVP